MRTYRHEHLAAAAATIIILAGAGPASAATFTSLYLFNGGSTDGGNPIAGLLPDGTGGYFGTTYNGGGAGCNGKGCGTVYKFSSAGKESVLYAFQGGSDGANANSSVIRDSAGNLYGTTLYGGNTACNAPAGCGTVYKISPGGKETQLHVFGGSEGALLYAPLVADKGGNLYGTAGVGASGTCQFGCGTVFEITNKGKFGVLHYFTGGADGGVPLAGLVPDKQGNLYGVASAGGLSGQGCSGGCGTVFVVPLRGDTRAIYSFKGGSDGYMPTARLVLDAKGNIYGATYKGGNSTNCTAGCGTVFKLTAAGKKTILYTFAGPGDGSVPVSLAFDNSGNLFGTAIGGGDVSKCGGAGCGTLFEIAGGAEHTVHTFLDGKDGAVSYSQLVIDASGKMYGTAEFDGGKNQACQYTATYTGCGVVYTVVP